MSSTRRLFSILMFIISIMLLYYTLNNYNEVKTYVTKVVRKYTKNTVIIPNYTKNHRIYLYTTVSETNNFEPHNIDDIKKIYYTVLNNGWDSFTFYCPYDYDNCIEDVKNVANSSNDDYISLINNYVSPYNSYKKYNTVIVDDNVITLNIEKLYTEEEINKLDNIINSYISKNINTDKITLKDIEKVHDYLLKKITYDGDYDKNNEFSDSSKATGALIKGVALCSGYSDAFALFLDKMNIPNFKINSEEHEWNAIYFNKKWNHIDLTWDDDEVNINNNRNFFMINTKDLLTKDKKEHNFNIDNYLEIK